MGVEPNFQHNKTNIYFKTNIFCTFRSLNMPKKVLECPEKVLEFYVVGTVGTLNLGTQRIIVKCTDAAPCFLLW